MNPTDILKPARIIARELVAEADARDWPRPPGEVLIDFTNRWAQYCLKNFAVNRRLMYGMVGLHYAHAYIFASHKRALATSIGN